MFVRFLHPDLGIGGAERLVLDLAKAIHETPNNPYSKFNHGSGTNQSSRNQIELCCNNWQPDRHFPETKISSIYHPKKLFMFIPRSIFGKFFALLAYLKMILASCFIGLFFRPSEVIIIDQVSHCIPFFIFFNRIQTILLSIFGIFTLNFKRRRTRVLFYCHWPDQLLAKYHLYEENGLKLKFYKIYRFSMDFFEKISLKMADKILVNSNFTANVVSETLKIEKKYLDILYPALSLKISGPSDQNILNSSGFDKPPTKNLSENFQNFKITDKNDKFLDCTRKILISINRYEKKKNVALAVEAVGSLGKAKRPILIIAGGFDLREKENIEVKEELQNLVVKHKLQNNVIFLTNITDSEKSYLLNIADCLIYTPKNEHFGIVPLEAMAYGTPVVAMRSGGPIETVPCNVGKLIPHETDKENKNLIANTAKAVEEILEDSQSYVAECKAHVRNNFSFESFQEKLLGVLDGMVGSGVKKRV